MTTAFLAATLLALAPQDDAHRSDPHRQFDFWTGEWSVQNRHIQPDGTWSDGDVTRARIVPVCGDRAILEEWAGPLRGGFMNGFSLRAWDPAKGHWALLLFWTVDGNSSFGQLTGNFRHGRDKDCLVLDLLETRAPGSEDWNERLSVRGFSAGTGAWEGWQVAEVDTVLRRSTVMADGEVLIFEHTDPATGSKTQEYLIPVDADNLQIEVLSGAGTDAEAAVTTTLTRT